MKEATMRILVWSPVLPSSQTAMLVMTARVRTEACLRPCCPAAHRHVVTLSENESLLSVKAKQERNERASVKR